MTPVRIVIFAKAPLPGHAKTRLVPELGEHGAAELAARMLRHTVAAALAADADEVELCVTPEPDARAWRPFHDSAWPVTWRPQADGDLGDKLAHAAHRGLAEGRTVVLIGTDCPTLSAARLGEACAQLRTNDAVLVPSSDGGYVLLGLKQFHPSVFRDIPWSTDGVAAATAARLRALDWSLARLPALRDIDEPADLAALPCGWSRP